MQTGSRPRADISSKGVSRASKPVTITPDTGRFHPSVCNVIDPPSDVFCWRADHLKERHGLSMNSDGSTCRLDVEVRIFLS